MDANYSAVLAVLHNYLEGLYHSDTSLLAKVFHPNARYICSTGAQPLQLSMDEYFPIVDKRPSPSSGGESRAAERILAIEFGGPNMAFARVECAIGSKFFTDFLTLILVDQKWQIIAKVFHYDLRETIE